jgi:flagella basal body P-ring formation protein FlgA
MRYPGNLARAILCSPSLALLGLLLAPSVRAAVDPAETARTFAADQVAALHPGLVAQIEAGDPDPQRRLQACAQAEASLRPGARLWGHSFVTVRCQAGARWSISVPVDVRLFGQAWVAAQPIPALAPLTPSMFRRAQVELSRESGGVVDALSEIEDRVSSRTLEPGQALPRNSLRMVAVVNQGDPVKVIGTGNGFTIVTEATALGTAAAGESLRVRTESGRTLAGVARRGRVVEVVF